MEKAVAYWIQNVASRDHTVFLCIYVCICTHQETETGRDLSLPEPSFSTLKLLCTLDLGVTRNKAYFSENYGSFLGDPESLHRKMS